MTLRSTGATAMKIYVSGGSFGAEALAAPAILVGMVPAEIPSDKDMPVPRLTR